MKSILDDFKLAFKTGNVLNQIIVINVVVFLFMGVLSVLLTLSNQVGIYSELARYLTLPADTTSLVFRPWSLITYFFFHEGLFHILFNMLWMYWFGRIIAEYLGQNKLLGFYFWGGIGGGLFYILVYNLFPFFADAVPYANLLGASAGVTAIVVGAATFQPNFTVNLILIGPVKLKYIAAFSVVASLLQSTGSNAGGEIAHLGGALVGYFGMVQLQKGNDWSKPIVSFIIWVKSLFKPQPKIKVSYKKEASSRPKAKASKRASAKTSSKKETSQAEIDAILDKISDKGYDALSKEEKQKLFNASKD
ncbi:rhomboid family intramembrane serine protease [Roseivirga sp. E12]|uniref:rhomboid family intramembrane serine protease n=1 Tax=Roseivirga sp. E12 TaxID=2819237 RepID=UPI001ABCCCF3|nr:rhomboid family intramembrane serine protease [Roseivirga sp. E12]MBO3699648.1 rhomboid family intramembrane serine protease [Roseivirga sp. E12]